MSLFSERSQPYLLANLVAGTSVASGNSALVDLQTANADSVFILGAITASTGTGFTMTAIAGASTTALGAYVVTPGSTSTLLTVSSTISGKFCYLDLKNVGHRYVGARYVGGGAINGAIIAFPYDSKTQEVPFSTDLASTVVGAGVYTSVNPTTA